MPCMAQGIVRFTLGDAIAVHDNPLLVSTPPLVNPRDIAYYLGPCFQQRPLAHAGAHARMAVFEIGH